jgi:hypothetical protein
LELARHSSEAIPRIAQELQIPIGPRVQVFLAAYPDEFQALQPRRPPEWADATAWPDRGAIFVRSPRIRAQGFDAFLQTFDHELTHVLLDRATAPHTAPRWLQEGVAQAVAREYGREKADTLAAATEPLSFSRLTSRFPASEHDAKLAYAQSVDFVSWLQANYGVDALPVLIRELAVGRALDDALIAATGEPMPDLEQAWRARFESAPIWSALAGSDNGLWFLIGALAIPAMLSKRYRLRTRMAEMAAREALLAAQEAEWAAAFEACCCR